MTERARGARQKARHRRARLLLSIGLLVAALLGVFVVRSFRNRHLSQADIDRANVAAATAVSPLRGRIVQIAQSQVGYQTDPSNTYCNKYSAYWHSGTADCAD